MDYVFSVDLISDLNLSSNDDFNWEGKPTSLFCVVAGNISADYAVIKQVLTHLSTHYRGVFYIDGSLEHSANYFHYEKNTITIKEICRSIPGVVYLHNHVVILNGIAFVGANGWYGNVSNFNLETGYFLERLRIDDLGYLTKTIKSLQVHGDAKQIAIITSCLPSGHLMFKPNDLMDQVGPVMSVITDTEHKIKTWMFGGYTDVIDDIYNSRRYVNNVSTINIPYWPKRVEIDC